MRSCFVSWLLFFLSKTHSLKLNKEAINESCVSFVKDCVIAPRWSETDGGGGVCYFANAVKPAGSIQCGNLS